MHLCYPPPPPPLKKSTKQWLLSAWIKVAFNWELQISDFSIQREIRKQILPRRNPSSGWISIKKSKSGFHGFPFYRSILACVQTSPSLRKNQERRRLWIAVVNRVPVYICINYIFVLSSTCKSKNSSGVCAQASRASSRNVRPKIQI